MNTQSGQAQRAIRFGIFGLVGGIVLALIVRFVIVGGAVEIPLPHEPTPPVMPMAPTARTLPISPVAPAAPNYPDPPIEPKLDNNSEAFAYLLRGSASGRYSVLKSDATTALSKSDDEALTYMADWFFRCADLMLQFDVDSFKEANSLSGIIQGLIAGLKNPILGVKAGYLLAQAYLGDFDKNEAALNAKYPPLLDAYKAAEQRYNQAVPVYQAAVQRIKQEYETAVQHYQQALQDYNTSVQQFKDYEVAVERYQQATQAYKNALDHYPVEHQAWEKERQRVDQKNEQNLAEATKTAGTWFWIVFIATPLAVVSYGITLNKPTIVPVSVSTRVKSDPEAISTAYCPKCGKQVSDKDVYCRSCGTPLSPGGNQTPKTEFLQK